MANIYTSLQLNGNRILDADLTMIPRESFPPDTLPSATTIIAGDGIIVTDNGDGTVTIAAKPPANLKVEAYRERFQVTDPLLEAPLLVSHNLGSDTVAVTVLEVAADGSRPVAAQVKVVDVNTVEVNLSGEPQAVFDILIVAGVDPNAVLNPAARVAVEPAPTKPEPAEQSAETPKTEQPKVRPVKQRRGRG